MNWDEYSESEAPRALHIRRQLPVRAQSQVLRLWQQSDPSRSDEFQDYRLHMLFSGLMLIVALVIAHFR